MPNLINGTHREKLFFTQFSTTMDAFLLLTFFMCLHSQLRSIHSITDVLKMRFIKYTVKMNGCSSQQVLRQNLSWFLSQDWKTFFP